MKSIKCDSCDVRTTTETPEFAIALINAHLLVNPTHALVLDEAAQ